jgi:hypothetical protein
LDSSFSREQSRTTSLKSASVSFTLGGHLASSFDPVQLPVTSIFMDATVRAERRRDKAKVTAI